MPITVTCDECSESHRVKDDAVGKKLKCKGCGKLLKVELTPASTVDGSETKTPLAVSLIKRVFLLAAMIGIGILAASLSRFVYRDSRSITEALVVFLLSGVVLLILVLVFAKVVIRTEFKDEIAWMFQYVAFRWLALLVVLGLSITFTIPVVGTLIRAFGSNSWPTVQGRVTKFQVTKHDYKGGIAEIPKVAYQYEVGGQFYSGSRIGVDWFGTDWREDRRVLRLPVAVGEPVTVHYEPTNPVTAVLVTGTTFSMWLILLPLVAFWYGLGSLLWMSVRRRATTPNSCLTGKAVPSHASGFEELRRRFPNTKTEHGLGTAPVSGTQALMVVTGLLGLVGGMVLTNFSYALGILVAVGGIVLFVSSILVARKKK